MPPLREALPEIVRALVVNRRRGGDPPASPFEAVIGFIAPGGAASGRPERLVSVLDSAGLLDPDALATASLEEVLDALRDARIEISPKAARLIQRVAEWYRDHRFVLECEPGGSSAFPREELGAIQGVGRATADAIALHVFGEAAYPVDRATYRILVRHGWIDPTVDYDEAAQSILDAAFDSTSDLATLSIGLAEVGRRFCKPAGPLCAACPLQTVLPDDGPMETDF